MIPGAEPVFWVVAASEKSIDVIGAVHDLEELARALRLFVYIKMLGNVQGLS